MYKYFCMLHICMRLYVCMYTAYVSVHLCVCMYLWKNVYINICICVSLHVCMLRMCVIFYIYVLCVCKYKMSAVYSSTRRSIYPPVRLHTYTFIYMPIYLSLYTIYPFVCQTDVCMYVCHVMSNVWMVVLWLLKNPFPKGW